ncbi:MAG: hypothetical protein IPP79_23880 [Chitinophagaceae bacterium]|nr:hypothetical protein [Chitinophagaceae bacterium]
MMKCLFLTASFVVFVANFLSAQDTAPIKIATDRLLWHENVDKQQQKLLNEEGVVALSEDPSINLHVKEALIHRVDELQRQLEIDSQYTSNIKKKYLRSLESMLKGFNENWRNKDYSIAQAPSLVKAFEECMVLDFKNESIQPVLDKQEYGVGKILVECFLYPSENIGVAPTRLELIRKYCGLHPDDILKVLRNYSNTYFTDSLIKVAAYRDISKLYDYAQARDELGARIRRHPDTLVHLISQMATSKSGRLYFPFLENLLRGKITIEEIDKVKENDLAYFRLMVQTRVEYAGRLLPPLKDTAREMKALTSMMARKAKEYFVNEINALHSVDNEAIRFKRLEGLSAPELYYIAVLSEDQIYTSSFVKGVYPRIFQRMTNPRGDSLLLSVNGDYFRKFIKMCAGYNTLNDFLGRMEKENASVLMKAFVIGLEKTEGTEEAVDVADSYSSIMDKNAELAEFIKAEVRWNLEKSTKTDSKKGKVIYNILSVLFESADTTSKINLSETLGIPPVYTVDYKSLKDDSGRIVMQAFFYGDEDKDGQNSFASFMGMFRNNPNWKIVENSEWVGISTAKGKLIQIYANKPLMGENDPEETAINHLTDYLFDHKLQPSIFIHRGHSFHVQSTMKRIMPTARIVILGSCGGYNNINEVLSISNDAHIISSKQTGTMHVNEPILQAMNSSLLAGKNIDWIGMWKELGSKFTTGDAKEKFDDYIPPFKNMGALFIKAYRKAMDTEK